MASASETSDFQVRERRLKSILAFEGTAESLNEGSKTLKLKTGKTPFTQCSDCSQMCAETLSYSIRDAAVIVHSPIGCCSAASATDVALDVVARERGIKEEQRVNAICSNINERDTVYGALDKLRHAIDTAFTRYNPSVIFVQSSCAAGIIGDDIESVTDEKMRQYGIPVVPVFCEGFKSKVWTSGFDAVFHGVLRKIVKPPRQRQDDLVNLFNFQGADSFTGLLSLLGLRVNYLLPLADVDSIAYMSEAACTAHICETLATYVAKSLEDEYGVPEVKAPAPFGITWTDEWLREIAKHTGKEDIVEQAIASEHARIKPAIDELRRQLTGKTVYVYAGDSYAHSLTNMAIELGMTPVGITTLHHDQRTDNTDEALNTLGKLIEDHGDIDNFTVCNKQPYQVVKLLDRIRPDVLIVRHMGLTVTGTKLGIPTICEGDVNISAGYDGIVKLGQRIVQVLKARTMLDTMAAHVEWPYTQWWLEQEDVRYEKEAAR